ncbi:MAG: ComEC/Rec2 family competence protein [Litorimonas sp.]
MGFFQTHMGDAVTRIAQYRPKFEGKIIAFAAGIVLYFAMPFEPSIWLCANTFLGLALIYWFLNRRVSELSGAVLCVLIMSMGVGRAAIHSSAVKAPRLPDYERSYDVTGWISDVDRSGTGLRYHIDVESIKNIATKNTPRTLRVRLARVPDTALAAGDSLFIRTIAKAPPGPVVPSGYDPARKAYFDQIGGFGFAISTPEKRPDIKLGLGGNIKRHIARRRYSLARRINAQAPPQTAGLQAALMTGVRRYIPQTQIDNLRVAGLAHILAISGLHMGLLAGGTYAAITFLLAWITPLSRRYDIRKAAAIIGALAAGFYLVLSGASVATQRAFIMAIIVFLAVILDRRAISMRSVAVAAGITLWVHPESLVSVGFQMSFAAVAALVVTYQTWQKYRPLYRPRNYMRRIADFFTSLSVTSFVAGLATGGFAVFHFNRISRYGFIGNLLAMPLFSLAVMPLAVVSFIAMPFGLEAVPLELMGFAIGYILRAANWVASWPNAMAHVPSAPSHVLAVFAVGFVAICVGRFWQCLGGVVIMVVCVGIWSHTPRPDLRVSEDGRVAFWLEEGRSQDGRLQDSTAVDATLMVDRRRADRYGREQFAQMAGRPDSLWQDYERSFADCDALACRFKLRGKTVSVMKHPSEVIRECTDVDLAILTEREAGPVARRRCEQQGRAVFLDAKTLRQSGALNIYFGGDANKPAKRTGETELEPRATIRLEPSRTAARARRPWGG